MTGIAGVLLPGQTELVNQMLDSITHRGPDWRVVIELEHATLGMVGSDQHISAKMDFERHHLGRDSAAPGHLAQAAVVNDHIELRRDRLGLAPLYYGDVSEGVLVFGSEMKALLPATSHIKEFPPGHQLSNGSLIGFDTLDILPVVEDAPETIKNNLHQRLHSAVQDRIHGEDIGAWLSGGLDSSTMVALARPYFSCFHTFAAGLEGAPDLMFARYAAKHLDTEHHEIILTPDDLRRALPEVIYHLESFDALLVRSSLTNYIAGQIASDYVSAVFSGEGGDELFAGYEYLKEIPQEQLANELIDITARLHNTALQRVDRCSAAHGLQAHVCFLDPQVLEYSIRIPSEYKLVDGVEKWILRQSVSELLPESILQRPKAKFWQGAGIGELLADYAGQKISDEEFDHNRTITQGWSLNSKEELLYYYYFQDCFGEFEDLSWMGRTKGAPIA